MNIGIITLPLDANYGGILQNWALQVVLRRLGHNPITLDYEKRKYSTLVLVNCKRILQRVIGKRVKIVKWSDWDRDPLFDNFIRRNITLSEPFNKYTSILISNNNLDAIIVGSDQVWRPKYSRFVLKERLLSFASKKDIIKIGYAISFGVNNWEFTSKETKECSKLAKQFNALSFRELSGCKMCKTYFGCDSSHVLDPTLLLNKGDYLEICKDIPVSKERFIASYILDPNEQTRSLIKEKQLELKLPVKVFSANHKSMLSIEEWIAIFRDADYIITDSFHGTVFSIIFDKPFHSVFNESRGSERFTSLLRMQKEGSIDTMRSLSIKYLKDNL